MSYLPTVVCGTRRIPLPLSGGGSQLLCQILCDSAVSSSAICTALSRDPPLTVFVLANTYDTFSAGRSSITIRRLADRLAAASPADWLLKPSWQRSAISPAELHTAKENCPWIDHAEEQAVLAATAARSHGTDVLDSPDALARLVARFLEISTGEGAASAAPANRCWYAWVAWQAGQAHQNHSPNAPLDESERAGIHEYWNRCGWTSLLDGLLEKLQRLRSLEREFDDEVGKAKLAAMKELAYGASHEINNPLANISSRAQTLLRDETNVDRQKALAAINRQAFRGHEMIADMMHFAHPPQPSFAACDPESLCRQAIDQLASEADERSIRLTFTKDHTELRDGEWDATQIVVAIHALVRNAIESIGNKGNVELAVRSDDDRGITVFRVQDDGPGIEERVREHMFDPFFSGREAGRGLGFGLSKAWRIAQLHGGLLTVESDDESTCFLLSLPWRV